MSIKEQQHGTVKWFNEKQGFGFIVNEAGEEHLVNSHSIDVDNIGFKTLAEGQEVTFFQVKTQKGLQAVEVEVLETA